MHSIIKNVKQNYTLAIIKLLFFLGFIASLIYVKISTSIYINFVLETEYSFQSYLRVFKETSYFKPTIILLIPLTGLFINNKIGWILIQSYFYFLISNVVFQIIYIDTNDLIQITISFIAFLLSLLIILLLNKKKISYNTYNISKRKLIRYNIIASIIGMLITIILAVQKVTPSY